MKCFFTVTTLLGGGSILFPVTVNAQGPIFNLLEHLCAVLLTHPSLNGLTIPVIVLSSIAERMFNVSALAVDWYFLYPFYSFF